MHKNLNEWLSYIEKLHPTEIELGLTRIGKVAKKLDLITFPAKVITVGGTNGKGTTCAFLEEILIQAGYKVGVYSSPHIQRFTERLRINHQELSEQAHCNAFETIENARDNVSLSFFEYATLSCLQLLKDQQCDFIILEVGLGGRLDATNIVQSDISVITTIAIDHVDWLGDNREVIGFEKAGIFRAGKPTICGELNPPKSIQAHAQDIGADIYFAGKDFIAQVDADSWTWTGKKSIDNLPKTLMPLQNASTALAVIYALNIEIDDDLIRTALRQAKLAGRLQKLTLPSNIETYIDVAHNPQSAQYLAQQITQIKANKPVQSKVYAIVGMLEDKDITGSFEQVNPLIDDCSLITLNCYRGASSETVLARYNNSTNKRALVNCMIILT
jgi:dihydrofolate synthase/folylpolyglutamate synthase